MELWSLFYKLRHNPEHTSCKFCSLSNCHLDIFHQSPLQYVEGFGSNQFFFPVGLILGAFSFLGGGSFSHHFTSLSKSLFDNNVEDPDDEENDEEKVVGCVDIKGDKHHPT